MQKFKHNNADIWIWKFWLLKIYLNTESWWLQAVDSRGMTQTERRKLQEKIFWTLNIFALSKFFLLLKLSSQLCLMKIVKVLFIGEDSDLKFYWIFNLEKFWNPSRVETVGAMKSVEEEYFSFLYQRLEKRKFLFTFPFSTLLVK